MKLSPIDKRLASRLHQRQIEVLIRCESVADAVDRQIDAAIRTFAAAVSDGRYTEAADALRRIIPAGLATIDEQFRRLAYWSHRETADALAEVIPRSWWRLAKPDLAALPLQEATVATGGGIIPPFPPSIVFTSPAPEDPGDNPLQVDLYSEPVAQGRRLSDAEWERLVKQVIVPPPTPAEIEAALYKQDPGGGTWRERFTALSRKISNPDAVAAQIVTSLSQGESLREATKRIEPLVQGVKSSARRIARTEGCRVAETMQRDAIDDLGGLLLGTQILAVLDQNTRPEHAARNGKIYYKSASDGTPTMVELPNLPDAPNCRCWGAPVLRTPKEVKSDPLVAASFANAEGDSIRDPAGYREWFDRADPSRRKMAVGAARYEAVRQMLGDSRPPEWTDFIDEEGSLLSRASLAAEDIFARLDRKRRVDAVIAQRTRVVQQIATRGFLLPVAQ